MNAPMVLLLMLVGLAITGLCRDVKASNEAHVGGRETHLHDKRHLMQGKQSKPEEISQDPNFIKCISENKCGLQNKCSFKIPLPKKDDGESNEMIEFVSGHILVVKNSMDYAILYYWDILGEETRSATTNGPQELFKNTNHSGLIYAEPHSMKWVDTRYYDSHTIRLFIVNEKKMENRTRPDSMNDVESIQTLISSDEDCTLSQTCKLLLNVCYLSSDQHRCNLYSRACNNFKDDDDIAKNMCIPECLYTYYSEIIRKPEDIDSNIIAEWVSRGGAIRGSGVDGLCNTSPVIGLSIAFIISLGIIITLLCIGKNYKRTLSVDNIDTSFSHHAGEGYI